MATVAGWEWEDWGQERGYQIIAGVDEVGRGPLAGPVVACACILPRSLQLSGVRDSKQLKSSDREAIYQELINRPDVKYGIGQVEAEEIDRINILQASFQAMRLALQSLNALPDLLLVDGHLVIPKMNIVQRPLIHGDALSMSIAAASIIAKVIRDALMRDYHEKYPEYGFAQHKGYGTKVHLEALAKWGPSPLHRKSFQPVKESIWQKA